MKKRFFYQSALGLLAVTVLGGCAASADANPDPGTPELAYEAGTLSMGAAKNGTKLYTSGVVIAGAISNTVPGIHVALQETDGAMINAVNVSEGDLDLAIIAGDVVYDAYYGAGSFEGKPLEDLRVLGACYQEVSGWAALRETGLTEVSQLKGKIISSGPVASATEYASELVYSLYDMDLSNTEIYTDTIANSVEHIKRRTADAVHAFAPVPVEAHQALAGEFDTVFLPYKEEELDQILALEPRYVKTQIPAGTYPGQTEPVPTFGKKVLVCANEDMDEDLAYEIARALDLNGPVYAAGSPYMSMIGDKQFLCQELPIPLHEGAEHYYRELGYLTEE